MFFGVRENYIGLPDQNAEFAIIFMHEWWPTRSHFVDEDAEGPPIHGESVSFLVKDFGC